jgi:hypothetical protein
MLNKEETMLRLKMKHLALLASVLCAAVAQAANFEITPTIQAELDRQKAVITTWAAEPMVVQSVLEQNSKGPIAGMDNTKWKTLRRSDPEVKAFQSNPAGQFLKEKVTGSGEMFNEAFLSAAQGEKVAFVEKTTSYLHKGQPKFEIPFTAGTPWQGKAEFDESSQVYAIQISVPVIAEGKPVGALVIGVNLTHLEKLAKQ